MRIVQNETSQKVIRLDKLVIQLDLYCNTDNVVRFHCF